jgi:hypothetical protein
MKFARKKRANHKPYSVRESVQDTGREVDQRKRVIEVVATADDKSSFRNLDTKQRRGCRLDRQLESMVRIVCEEEVFIPLGESDYPIYYIDDTEGAMAEHPRINLRYWTPGSVKSLRILDEPEHRDKGFMLYSKDNQLICYKLSDKKRCKVNLKQWEEHYATFKEACEVLPNNPRGERKAGVYFKYLMFGWHQARKTKEMEEYVFKNLPEKDKKDPEKVAAHAAKVKRVQDGLKTYMSRLEKAGLIAVPEKDLSIQNKLRKVMNLFKIFRLGWKGRFSQLAMATLYWSPCHVDDDIFYTLLSCYNHTMANRAGKENILFYFLFPSAGIAVPMRTTDILVFNSAFPHCTSNYRFEETITMSMFTSAKTAVAQMANNADLVPEPADEEERKEEE